MNNFKLNNFEAIAIILTITITHSILTLPKAIMTPVDSAALLNIIYVSILAFILSIIIYKLLNKYPGLDIIDISEIVGGKLFKRIVGFVFLAYILFVSSVILRTFSHCLKIVYYPMTDLIFIIAIFAISIPISCSLSSETVFKANIIIIPVVLLSIVFLFVANTRYFNFQNVFPLFGNGLNATFVEGSSNIFAFGGITVLYLLPPVLKDRKQFKKVSIISTVLSSIYLVLIVATILFMFSTISFTNELMPLYSAVRYIEFGTFFQRLDSAAIFIYILGLLCTLAINLTITLDIIKQITNISNTKPLLYPCLLISFSIALSLNPNTVVEIFENQISKALYIILVIIIPLFIFIFTTLKQKNEKKEAISESIH